MSSVLSVVPVPFLVRDEASVSQIHTNLTGEVNRPLGDTPITIPQFFVTMGNILAIQGPFAPSVLVQRNVEFGRA